MLILLTAAALAASGPTPSTLPAPCRPAADKAAAAGRVSPRKLGDLPPGQQIKAVWRFDQNGCPSPVVVRARVGADGR